jgi:hypothetical protein
MVRGVEARDALAAVLFGAVLSCPVSQAYAEKGEVSHDRQGAATAGGGEERTMKIPKARMWRCRCNRMATTGTVARHYAIVSLAVPNWVPGANTLVTIREITPKRGKGNKL